MSIMNTADALTGYYPPASQSPGGVNGKGVMRPGATATVGGRQVVSGPDVTNQTEAPSK